MSATVPDPVWDWEEGLGQGYLGFEVDPTPNENYTVEGVGSDAPTPETDAGARAAAIARKNAIRDRLSGTESGPTGNGGDGNGGEGVTQTSSRSRSTRSSGAPSS